MKGNVRGALAFGAAIALFLPAGCSEPEKPIPQLDERHVITVDGSTVRYNGKLLRWDVPAERWQDVLGPYNRRSELGHILTWDQLGVVLYENSADLTASSMVVAFGRTGHSPAIESKPEFWPKEPDPNCLVNFDEVHRQLLVTPFFPSVGPAPLDSAPLRGSTLGRIGNSGPESRNRGETDSAQLQGLF